MSLADVMERLMAEFEDRHSLTRIVSVVTGCRHELQRGAVAPQPELVELLARRRLLDAVGPSLVAAPHGAERLDLTYLPERCSSSATVPARR